MTEDIKKPQTEGKKPETSQHLSQAEGELSEDKLENVAGGGPKDRAGKAAGFVRKAPKV